MQPPLNHGFWNLPPPNCNAREIKVSEPQKQADAHSFGS